MLEKIQNISVIGDGGWGTTIAVHLSQKNYKVSLWGAFPTYIEEIKKSRCNTKFLPAIVIPENTYITSNLCEAVTDVDLIVFAVPSKFANKVIQEIKKAGVDLRKTMFLSLTKGLDEKKLKRISEVITESLNIKYPAVLSGPNIASEVALGVPSMATIACKSKSVLKSIQEILNSENFRIYTNSDIIGVELGGGIKNIIAIACGICDGLGYGVNTKAALLTRGLNEMSRFAERLGAESKTLSGLSGLGDLITTSFSPKSRNRSVGEQIGKGLSLTCIMKDMEMVAEGVDTVRSIYKIAKSMKIPMPITEEVYKIIYKEKSPKKAVIDLMQRDLKSE